MLELLNTIILACHISTGSNLIEQTGRIQAKCHKELIECTGFKIGHEDTAKTKIINCMIKRADIKSWWP